MRQNTSGHVIISCAIPYSIQSRYSSARTHHALHITRDSSRQGGAAALALATRSCAKKSLPSAAYTQRWLAHDLHTRQGGSNESERVRDIILHVIVELVAWEIKVRAVPVLLYIRDSTSSYTLLP